jgi:hypothetical protein
MEILTKANLLGIQVSIDEKQVIIDMIENLTGKSIYKNVYVKDDKLVYEYDGSYHCSYSPEYDIITTDVAKIKKFQLLKELLNVIETEKVDETLCQ